MNATLLLVTTAWFAGADPEAPKAEKMPAPASSAPAAAYPIGTSGWAGGCGSCGYTGCSTGCDSGCDSGCGSGGLLGRLKGLFRRRSHDDCGCCETASSCCATAPVAVSCGSSCGDTCGDGCGEGRRGLLSRLTGMFRRGGDCCDTCGGGCGGCGGCGGYGYAGYGAGVPAYGTPVMPRAEQMPAPKGDQPPKRMPSGGEPPMKPISLQPAPRAVPNLTVETEKSPF